MSSNEESKLGFQAAVNAYLENVPNHEHAEDAVDCDGIEAFYVIGYVAPDGTLATYAGGHKMDANTVVAAMVGVVDEFMMTEMTDLPPILRFARSRDLIHNGADALAPPGEVSQALNQFVDELGSDDVV